MNRIPDCDAFAEDLSHFVLGELPDERRPALEQHLVSCAACRAERDLLARSVDLVKSEAGGVPPALELSQERRADLLAQAASASRPPRRWLTIERLAAAAAVVIGGSIAGRWIVRHSETIAFDVTCDTASLKSGAARSPEGEEIALRFGYPEGARAPAAATPDPAYLADGSGDPSALAAASELSEAERIDRNAVTEELQSPELTQSLALVDDAFHGRLHAIDPAAEAAPNEPQEMALLQSGGAGGGGAAEPAGGVSTFVGRKLGTGLRRSSAGGKAVPGPTTGGLARTPPPGDGASAQTPEALKRELEELGYATDDSFDAGIEVLALPGEDAGQDGALLAQQLAAANAPSDLAALQPQLVAAFGFDPNTPATADGAREGERRAADLVREFLDQLAPRQGETPRDMFFRYFGDHPFVTTRIDARSTFGMDVDTASYALVRAYLTQGNLPPKAAVRTEEFVNAFRHAFAPPAPGADDVFAIHTELAPSPFGEGKVLLQVGLKAREIAKEARRPAALTFVIDTSGSMEEGGRLELVKSALHLLVDQLDERDTIGIVRFSNDGQRVLDPTNAANRSRIFAALDTLRPDGSTNAGAGLRLGYDMALEQLKQNGENRVIFCSDGVANTGVTDPEAIVGRIRDCKSKNLYLNCIGVGMNNHNDALMEQLADEGDGACDYVDRIDEARKIFVEKLTGTLTTVAKNAKIQVEFDPASVARFRQLGYENRALAHRDFRNDRVDAGEVGAGHEVVALYELELRHDAAGPLATVRCRYEDPRAATIHEQAREVFVAESEATVQQSTPRFRLAAAVAEFAEILRQSIHARDGSLSDVLRFAEPLVAELPGDPDVAEFVALVQQAARLPDLLPRRTDLVRAVDELKKSRCMQEELRNARRERSQPGEAARDQANDDLMRQLEEQNRKLEEALRDALERTARGS